MDQETNIESIYKVAPEVADKYFFELCEKWDIDYDDPDFDEDEKKSFDGLKRTIVRKIMDGSVTFHDDQAVYRLQHPIGTLGEFKFTIPKGEAMNKLDKYKAHEDQKAMNAYIGSMIGQPPSILGQTDQRDLKVARAFAKLFLAL